MIKARVATMALWGAHHEFVCVLSHKPHMPIRYTGDNAEFWKMISAYLQIHRGDVCTELKG